MTVNGNGLRHRHVQGEVEPANEPSSSTVPRRTPRPQKGFVELLMSPLSFVLGDGEPEDPQTAARNFAHSLQRRYGENVTPRFEHTSFRDAVSTARTASKFLLVFLHSNIHDDADAFCRKSICTERMSTYLNNSDCIVSWAGCVQHAEGFGVSLSLGCATFPFLALLSCLSRGIDVVEKITANVPAEEIIKKLDAAVDHNNQTLATARHIHQQRTETQILREQQDREYQEALEADRRRETEAREQAELAESKRLQKEEEERRAEEEKINQEEKAKAEIEAKRARITDGPKTRTPSPNANYKTAVIKFHLHNGKRLEHIFYAHDTLGTVRDFIDVEFYDRDIPIRNYELATNYPKKVYGPELLNVTLADAGLAPQALVYVQDLDS
ncbi:Predicted regulator of the ubiquitin pathway (contains UAS and UBX domains) [Plasmopara halstedii]|uniref:Predicted regulator of the ubiquitin pathway (Contains UAS and UBX domains) n=1 Tax=Plasmopara halstedii TaxID=4781 RepID=A0A0N7L4T6_PLAHL|nr:Predicted regulator of the ubiquitin pathway (contains UAS and UBX domains) [Plasmopara halstedii]CEG39579.1 Predicted regulator of the ubiquitin pathway (contains UAS and UBX domains) [Plasmopara halstedii]|eukprot:XP_024575948.1 Predicted regulator of the ubiquitin pathway (contains UAS and UBX domains) [Plasmopara halstedii]